MNQVEELQLLEHEIARHAKRLVTSVPTDYKQLENSIMQATQVLVNDPSIPQWAITAWQEVGIRIVYQAHIARLTEDQ